MKVFKLFLFSLTLFLSTNGMQAQCNQTMSINSISGECNGDGTSTVTINVTVLFGNGNNSATISYDIGAGTVVAVVLEDDDGDIINMTYIFNVPSCDNYSVSLTGWSNPSGSGNPCTDPAPVTTSIILPVTFGYFNISKSGVDVILEWSTLTETNNEKFVIQRTDDRGDFINLGEIKGAINSLREKHYQFVDSDNKNGTYYYRLKQIDLDGHFTYSDLKTVNINRKSNLLVFPNPAQEYVSISASTGNSYRLINAYGKVITTLHNIDAPYKLDISQLDIGMYYLQSITNGDTVSFIKI